MLEPPARFYSRLRRTPGTRTRCRDWLTLLGVAPRGGRVRLTIVWTHEVGEAALLEVAGELARPAPGRRWTADLRPAPRSPPALREGLLFVDVAGGAPEDAAAEACRALLEALNRARGR